MERIRIDRRDQRRRARARADRAAPLAPLQHRTGDSPVVDDELLARIDTLLGQPRATGDAPGL